MRWGEPEVWKSGLCATSFGIIYSIYLLFDAEKLHWITNLFCIESYARGMWWDNYFLIFIAVGILLSVGIFLIVKNYIS